jgi:hypothetical protein
MGVSEAEEATTVVLCRGESECTLPACLALQWMGANLHNGATAHIVESAHHAQQTHTLRRTRSDITQSSASDSKQ